MDDRRNGVVDPKQWMKFLQGYIKEKRQQLSVSGLWHMPFLIRYTVFLYALYPLVLTLESIENENTFP